MSKWELFWRRIGIKYFNKKYCNYKARHGHDLYEISCNNKYGYERIRILECRKCGIKVGHTCLGLEII